MIYNHKDRRGLPLGGASDRIEKRHLTLNDFQRFAIRRGYTFTEFKDWDPTTTRPFMREQFALNL